MIRLIYILLIMFLFVVLTSCVYNVQLKPIPDEGQTIRFFEGKEICVSPGTVGIGIYADPPVYKSTSRPTFYVLLSNNGNTYVNFSPETINASNNGNQLKTLSLHELVAEIEKKRKNAIFTATLTGLAQSYNTSLYGNQKQYHYGTYSDYSGNYSGTYFGHTYDPSSGEKAQAAIQAQTIQNFSNINTGSAFDLYNIKKNILQKQTLLPGDYYSGYIKIETPAYFDQDLIINIEIEGIYKKFTFSQNIVTY